MRSGAGKTGTAEPGNGACGRAVGKSAPFTMEVRPGAPPDSPASCARVSPAWPFQNCAADQKWDRNPSVFLGALPPLLPL